MLNKIFYKNVILVSNDMDVEDFYSEYSLRHCFHYKSL